MVTSSSNFYQLGASLPVDALSYVRRLADEEFYQKLRLGKFRQYTSKPFQVCLLLSGVWGIMLVIKKVWELSEAEFVRRRS